MIAKFFAVFCAMTVVCSVVWQYTAADLYDCTDNGPFPGYLEPGWVHAWGGHPVITVVHIVHNRPMNEPDAIKEGWSVSRLWRLWYAFTAVALLASLIVARLPWSRMYQRS